MKIYPIMGLLLLIISSCIMAFRNSVKTVESGARPGTSPDALFPVKQSGKWGYINSRFELVIPARYEHAEDFSEGFAAISELITTGNGEPKELFGFINREGKKVVACKYEKVFAFSEGLAAVIVNQKYGFIDTEGKEVIAPQYEDLAGFSEGLAVVKLNGRNGFINKKGMMIIQPRFVRAPWVSGFKEGLAPVYLENDTAGFIDSTGNFVIDPKFSYVSAFSEGLALVQPVGSRYYGFIDKKGEFVIKAQYDLSLPFSEGVATVKLTRKDGRVVFRLIDKSGGTVADNLDYGFVGIFRDGLAGVESHQHRWGFIDKKGKEVIPPKYASVRLFKDGLSKVETGSLFGGLQTNYIDKKGNLVYKN